MSTPQYEQLRDSITADDCLKAFDYLLNHIGYGQRTGIEDIAYALYQSRSENAVRKARDVVELLRTQYGIAVCSTSGKAGRWLASSEAEKEECLQDFYARLRSIKAVIDGLQKAKVPPPRELHETAIQIGLW